MSDTQAAMREFRFLDEKRKTEGLTPAEDQHWQQLAASLGITPEADPSAPAQGAYGPDGQWYPHAPQGYDPQVWGGQPGAWPGYYQQQPQGYYGPDGQWYQYPPQPQGYYGPDGQWYQYPQQPYAPPQGYYTPDGQWVAAPVPPQPQWDPQSQQWVQAPLAPMPAPPAPMAPAWAAQPPPAAVTATTPAYQPPVPQPSQPSTASPGWQRAIIAPPRPLVTEPAPAEVSADEVMEIADEEVEEIAPPEVAAPTSRGSSVDPVSELRNALTLDDGNESGFAAIEEAHIEPLAEPIAPSNTFAAWRQPIEEAPLLADVSVEAEAPSAVEAVRSIEAEIELSAEVVAAEPAGSEPRAEPMSDASFLAPQPQQVASSFDTFTPLSVAEGVDRIESFSAPATIVEAAPAQPIQQATSFGAPTSEHVDAFDRPVEQGEVTSFGAPTSEPQLAEANASIPVETFAQQPTSFAEPTHEPIGTLAEPVSQGAAQPTSLGAPTNEHTAEPSDAQPTSIGAPETEYVGADAEPIAQGHALEAELVSPPTTFDDVAPSGSLGAPLSAAAAQVEVTSFAAPNTQRGEPAPAVPPSAASSLDLQSVLPVVDDAPEPAFTPRAPLAAAEVPVTPSFASPKLSVDIAPVAEAAQPFDVVAEHTPPAAIESLEIEPLAVEPIASAPEAFIEAVPSSVDLSAIDFTDHAPEHPPAAQTVPPSQRVTLPGVDLASFDIEPTREHHAPISRSATPVEVPAFDAPAIDASHQRTPLEPTPAIDHVPERTQVVPMPMAPVEQPSASVTPKSAFDDLALPPDAAPIPTFAAAAATKSAPQPSVNNANFPPWDEVPEPISATELTPTAQHDRSMFGSSLPPVDEAAPSHPWPDEPETSPSMPVIAAPDWEDLQVAQGEPIIEAEPAVVVGDLEGDPAQTVELAATTDFLPAWHQPAETTQSEEIEIEADLGSFEVESGSAAALATNVAETASSVTNERVELASNAEFINHTALKQTGESWQSSTSSVEIEGELLAEEDVTAEHEHREPEVSWGVAVTQPSPVPQRPQPAPTTPLTGLPPLPAARSQPSAPSPFVPPLASAPRAAQPPLPALAGAPLPLGVQAPPSSSRYPALSTPTQSPSAPAARSPFGASAEPAPAHSAPAGSMPAGRSPFGASAEPAPAHSAPAGMPAARSPFGASAEPAPAVHSAPAGSRSAVGPSTSAQSAGFSDAALGVVPAPASSTRNVAPFGAPTAPTNQPPLGPIPTTAATQPPASSTSHRALTSQPAPSTSSARTPALGAVPPPAARAVPLGTNPPPSSGTLRAMPVPEGAVALGDGPIAPSGPVPRPVTFDMTGGPLGKSDEPILVAGAHRVILHTLEGGVKRGSLQDANLNGTQVVLETGPGANETVARERVKAIFFMLAPGSRSPSPEGAKVRVTFRDGRQVAGFSKDHTLHSAGFFVVPADNRTNTERIFIYRHSIASVTVEH